MNVPAASEKPLRNDFADWLSPMLVKELRQGMRTRVFVFSFILLQILMTLNVVIGLLGTANGIDSSATTAIFWAMVCLPVLLILPLSGLGALSEEKAANTLELIFLTRLSAWRIVFGKWFAIVAQIALFTCAVLPYAVLRYFMGGVNLADNFVGLVHMLTSAAVLTAVAVGISPFQTRVMRVLSIFGILFLIMVLFEVIGSSVALGGGSVGGPGWKSELTALLLSVLMIALMLQIAAGKIAPPAENHSAIKRAIGIGFFVLAVTLWLIGTDPGISILGAIVCCVPVLIGAVCDPMRWNQNVYRPFVRRGLPGRICGRLFYPGWPSGVIFSIFLMAGFGALLFTSKGFHAERPLLIFLAGVGLILFPAAVTRLCFRRTENPLAVFIGTVAVCAVFTILASILDAIFNSGFRVLLCLLPPCAFIESVLPILKDTEISQALLLCVAGDVVGLLTLFLLMPPIWKRVRAIEKEIAAPSANEPLA